MPSKFYEQLSKEAKFVVDLAMDNMNPHYDPEVGLVGRTFRGKKIFSHRASLYYALGLMLQGKEDHVAKTEKIVRAVVDMQIDAPGEIFHGAYVDGSRIPVVFGALDQHRLGSYARYYIDCFYEKMADHFRIHLEDDPELAPFAGKIESYLNKAVSEIVPLVWSSYDPNMREFNMMSFAMLLEHFSDELSPECVALIDHTCKLAMEGAVTRSKDNFTPLNTNIQCMHAFVLDYYGTRWNRQDLRDYAIEFAQGVVDKYLKYHSAAEFNSPTYCGVDLSALSFWQLYGSNDKLKELGKVREEGIWQDTMEFYNPAMKNFCGPHTRAYALDIYKSTDFPALVYMALGEEESPLKPIQCDTLMPFGQVNMPESARKALLTEKQDVVISHQFRELSERGGALLLRQAELSAEQIVAALAGYIDNPRRLAALAAAAAASASPGATAAVADCVQELLKHG